MRRLVVMSAALFFVFLLQGCTLKLRIKDVEVDAELRQIDPIDVNSLEIKELFHGGAADIKPAY